MSGSHFRYPGNILYFLPMQFADCLDGVPSDDRDENDQDRLALGHGKCDKTVAPRQDYRLVADGGDLGGKGGRSEDSQRSHDIGEGRRARQLNRPKFSGGCLVWLRRPGLVPQSEQSSAPRPRREACCRSVQASGGC